MTKLTQTGTSKRYISKLLRNPVFWITILTIGFMFVLAIRPSEAWFGVPGEWTWSGRPPSPSTYSRWMPAILTLICITTIAITMDRQWERSSRRVRALGMVALIVLVPVLQILLQYIHRQYPLEFYLHRTIGPLNGFWQTAISIENLPEFLQNFDEAMLSLRDEYIHLATHPPGSLIWIWIWQKLFELLPRLAHSIAHYFRLYACADLQFVMLDDAQIAAALGQISIVFISGLGIIPMYLWAKQITTQRNAWRAVTFYALLPTLSLFTMRWDTLYPLFTASTFAAIQKGLVSKKKRWWFLAGLIVSISSFFSFGNATLAPAVALYALLFIWLQNNIISDIFIYWKHWGLLILGGFSIWGIYQAVSGLSVFDLLSVTRSYLSDLGSSNTYHKWIFYNITDTFAMSGYAITIPFILQAIWSIRQLLRKQKIDQINKIIPAVTFILVIVLVNLSGLTPGETARLWIHFVTGMIIATVLWLDHNAHKSTYRIFVGLLALQCLWLTLFLRVSDTNYPSYIHRDPALTAAPATQLAHFEEGITLTDIELNTTSINAGQSLSMSLEWYAESRPDIPYTAFIHIIDTDDNIIAQSDGMPVNNSLPTTCWIPGETIKDTHIISIPENTPPGEYQLHVGWYDLWTMHRLELQDDTVPTDIFVPDVGIKIPQE